MGQLTFNSTGNLHKNVELSLEELKKHFGTNAGRLKKIETALLFFKLFSTCGCTTVYIGGSFVSTKKHPEDIDLCFDLTYIDYKQLESVFPDFFDFNKIGEIRRNLECHILYFDNNTPYFFQMLQEDRSGHLKGLVKVSLKDIYYD